MLINTSITREISKLREDEDVLKEIQENALEDHERHVLSFPSLFFIRSRNPFIPLGRFVKRFDDGYEECVVGSQNGRMEVVGYRGPIYPHATIAPFLQAVKRHGMDTGSARVDRRRQMAQIGE